MGFWSHLDPVGQPEAVTFTSETEALTHIQSWDAKNSDFTTKITIRAVDTVGAQYASIAQIQADGFPGWDPTK